ncbi:short-chain dehydrogenase/reductase SDR [Gloeothece citriformis PCC 7424]|uniref:Short-chain dehydrogenase/reductase SDR n=1 Tax=Gloeothece citriformis (strain PCC 7424) TaxID=65393 RepID=B7KGU0_GLOC7|nr:SDR family oxidoreductase [Gloeothece citriformis]ACK73427.1 short-chain dehydrogenase/reductase SDR [Gloeothece citriformis PCC 7424]
MDLKPINQQVVAIVGASSGIGRETALKFARGGAKVVVAARSQSGLDSLIDEIKGFGGEAVSISADVLEFDQVKAIADKAIEEYGRLDTWVHCAAIALYAPFEQVTPEEFKRVIDVDLMGQVYGAMVALPHLRREGRGALIHISSILARRSFPLQSAYCAAKHGINGFLESLRVELMHEMLPISVTEISPCSINTPFFTTARTKLGVQPMGAPPIYEPSIVADSIVYAAQHPTRDMIVGDAAKMIWAAQRVSPALLDAVLARTGFNSQRTAKPKTEDEVNSFYQPSSEFDHVEGDFGDQSLPVSVSDWLDTHPVAKWGVVAGTLGLVFLAGLAFKDNWIS